MNDIAANSVETEKKIKLLRRECALEIDDKRYAANGFRGRSRRDPLPFWRPYLSTMLTLQPLVAAGVVPIANYPGSKTSGAKMAVFLSMA